MSEPAGEDDGQDGRLPGNVKGSTADSEEKIPFRLWFDDGSVVLVAERTAFRVHASLLSRHSPPLKKLFAIPRSSKGEHMMDGCPVFHLSDTAADLDHFLQLIYDTPRYALDSTPLSPALTTYGAGATPKSLPLPCNPLREVVKPTFARLSAYIRLGYKYEIFSLVDDAVRYLEAYFTTNFDIWEKLRKGERDVPFTFSENPAADAIDTVNLARMVGKPSLLPLALYLCCQLDPVDLIEGVQRSDSEEDSSRVFSLSSTDIALCLRAKQTLLKASANVAAISLLLYQCSREPEFSMTCTDRVYGISESGVLRLDQDLTTDPLGYLPYASGGSSEEGLPQHDSGPVELCGWCKSGIASRTRSARQRIWRELPASFELLTLDPEIRMVINDPLVREGGDEGD